MSNEEVEKIEAFVASMGFHHTSDMISLTSDIRHRIEHRRELAEKRAAQEAKEWAPGGWRRDGESSAT